MHGAAPVLRTWLTRAPGWQRALVAVAMTGAGALLVAIGHPAGAAVGLAGLLLLFGTVRHRLGALRRAPGGATEREHP